MRRWVNAVSVLVQCLIVSSAHAQAGVTAAKPVLAISVAGISVDVSGATSRGNVLIFGSAVTQETLATNHIHASGILAADADGKVHMALPSDVGTACVFFVVDMKSGETAIATPTNSPARELPTPKNFLKQGSNKKSDGLVLPFEVVDVVLIRPDQGAWKAEVADGGQNDEDKQANGSSITTFERLKETEKNKKPPKELQKNDILIVIDPLTLGYMLVRAKE